MNVHKNLILAVLIHLLATPIFCQGNEVKISSNMDHTLLVDGNPFFINGMNWDYFPIGTNYNYSLWNQPDDVIMAALDYEMRLLKNMGVNTIRQYVGVPKKWIEYIYNNYGIFTVLNHSFGRYGLTLDGAWVANTEYSDPRVNKLLLDEVTQMVSDYKSTKGLLMFLLGNENNYGLFWEGAETEDIPVSDRKSTIRAEAMYSLFNLAAKQMKSLDHSHPVAICNGDLLFLDIINKLCPDVDVLGINIYRGVSFGDAFQRVKNEYGKPLMFTEFGADAYNVKSNKEDQESQAYYMVENWREIYKNAANAGGAGNALGGFTFQFSDGWWKFGQTLNLSVHDNNASWSNGGYLSDYEVGFNNMNEEWFGICAKGPNDERGVYSLFPRASYFALKDVHDFNPLDRNTTHSTIDQYFNTISLSNAILQAQGSTASLESENLKKIKLSRLTAEFSTYNTGGDLISTPKNNVNNTSTTFPNSLGFDHMQSFYIGVAAQPSPSMNVNVEFNVLGNIALNPINEIFYENRGRPVTVETQDLPVSFNDRNRLSVYKGEINWNQKYFDLTGFYRSGHYHWGYEGDFFGLYPEANYGPNIDIYNGVAPVGMEIDGKRALSGLTVAFGPELWWGANPAILLKYSKNIFGAQWTGIFHKDIAQRVNTESSYAIPQPQTRRATLQLKKNYGKFGIELGGIWAGKPLVGRTFQLLKDDEQIEYQDDINNKDTWGGKIKLTLSAGKINWYAQGAVMSLVANGGADYTKTFTGWRLKDSGSGNQYNVLSGFTLGLGKLQIAPNFLYQKPIVGPIPADIAAPGRPRNILDDPFVVRTNRETTAGEILFTYDPTPATWMYDWDNDRSEDAKFAMNAGFVFRHLPTIQDAAIGILADGRVTFAFPSSAPAADLWEAYSRIVSKINPNLGIVANIFVGNGQANGSDPRLIQRAGADLRLIYKSVKVQSKVQLNDWGPYDYHRDFNLTYPQQYTLDISTVLGIPSWLDLPQTKLGIQGIYRTLDQYSPRYCPLHTIDSAGDHVCDPTAPGFNQGREWQIKTYLHINIFQ
ncbi:MAG: glycoside hydrolase family 2 TIM barrel-domain containing protein [Saprospiraceae bacterium]